MSETMSSPSSDWVQFYQHNLSGQPQTSPATMFLGDRASEATVVTTTVTSSSHLSPEGRVSKPVRRRSRASRRTPTTLLNTDTTNFRAMVQQFTGGPSAPFGSGSGTRQYHPGAANFNLGLGARQQVVNPTAVMVPRAGYNVQFHQQQQPQQYQQQQQQQQQYMFSLNNNNTAHHAFLQRLQNSTSNMEVSGGLVMEGVSSHVPPRPRDDSRSNENTGVEENYMF